MSILVKHCDFQNHTHTTLLKLTDKKVFQKNLDIYLRYLDIPGPLLNVFFMINYTQYNNVTVLTLSFLLLILKDDSILLYVYSIEEDIIFS